MNKNILFIEYPNVKGVFAKINYSYKKGVHKFKPMNYCYDKNGNTGY